VLLLTLVLLVGCADDGSLALRDWTFHGPDGEPAPLALPAHVGTRLPHEATRFVLTRTVSLGPALRDRELVLVIPRLLAHARLLVDGAPAQPLTGDDSGGYREKGPHAWRIAPRPADRIELAIEVDSTWTQAGWLDTVPRLTTAPDGGAAFAAQRTLNDVGDFASLELTLFVAYLYGVVFLADRRRRTYLWFALTGLAGSTFPMFQTAVLSRALGPLEVTLVSVGVSSSVVTQIHFTRAYYGEPPPSRLWNIAWGAVALLCIASTGYFTGTQVAGVVTVVLAIPAILSQATLFLRLARRRPLPVNLYLVFVGWLLLPFLAAPDFAAWCGLGEWLGGTRGASLDIALIALLQTAALSREHTLSLRRADDLAAEREARIRELEVLNDELRRQIAARSRDLGDAITRMTGVPGDRELLEGETIEGRYQVIRKLGAGAAGNVYLVERKTDGARLAMKVVRGAHSPSALARLAREAQLAANVKHENVIVVVDVDVAASGFLYVVMEYVAGDTLKEHRAEYGAVKWSLDVLRQIAAGLAAVHARGIVHRDLKPANVLLVQRDGQPPLVKIADFGIAGVTTGAMRDLVTTASIPPPAAADPNTLRSPKDLRLTETGMLLGTPLYMAPEAIDGAKNAAAPIDVFSFGVIAYELLTGAVPFVESPALCQLSGTMVAPPAPIRAARPEVPAEVAALIDRCLSFNAIERPAAAEAVAVLREARVPSTVSA
jgi:serine/threonine-protein kinase